MIRALVVMALLCGCHRNGEQKLREDTHNRESYSLGYQLGTSFKGQGVSIDVDAYVTGLRHALAGKAAEVTAQELQSAVLVLRGKAIAAQQKKVAEDAEKNRAAGSAFRDANQKRDGVTVLQSGVQVRVLKDGTGMRPKPSDKVTIHYRSSFVDGKELASSVTQRQPITVALDHVIRGWREALPLMKEGAKWELVVPPELAYGKRGSTGIGPNSTLVFEVELLRVNPTAQ